MRVTIYMKEQINENNYSAVALGFFDGIHQGHRAVIGKMLKVANEKSLTPIVYTFQKNPALLFGRSVEIITPNEERQHILKDMGVSKVIEDDFLTVKDYSPREFVEKILVEKLNAKEVFCGFNYHFGKGGVADHNTLKEICKEFSINVTVADQVVVDGDTVSSTRIRKLIKNGEMEEVNKLLGHRFGYTSVIEQGNHIGRLMDTPTINQKLPDNIAIPKFGVYTSLVTIKGEQYVGVTNVGVKPTVGNYKPLSETWLPEYNGPDLYGEVIDTRLLCFQRPEKKFDSLAELEKTIKNDGKNTLINIKKYIC